MTDDHIDRDTAGGIEKRIHAELPIQSNIKKLSTETIYGEEGGQN